MNHKPNFNVDRSQLGPDENLCDYCTAKCCRYFALQIETPRIERDFDFMRWYLLHDRASVFVDTRKWYLLVHTTCKHLRDDHKCGIYETRPQICRSYTTDECEFDENFTYPQYFEAPEQIHEFANAIFNTPDTFRTPRPQLNVIPS